MTAKKVLLITPYFAPQTHAAMFRVYKLARYLPSLGYEVHVLTVDTNYLYNEDESLLAQLPEEVKIHKARYIEPTFRGLKMALGGKDTTFASLKRQGAIEQVTATKTKSAALQTRPTLVQRFKQWLANRPDRYWTWYTPALKQARRIIQRYDIQLIYTTTAPYTCLRIGDKLKRELGIRWVSDYRDPLGYSERFSAPSLDVQQIEKQIVRSSMKSADHVVGLARSYEYIFSDLYQVPSERFSFIPTGADDAYIRHAEKEVGARHKSITVLFVGEFLDEYDSNHIFKALDQASLKLPQGLTLKVIGRKEVNQHRVERLLNSASCDNLKVHCEFIDHMPQSELYAEILRADACLLIPGNSLWWTNFAKLVDYIAMKKTVIADVPLISEARHELERSGLGVFLSGELIDDTNVLLDLFDARRQTINHEYCKTYLASSQVASFAKVFNQQLGISD
ncbi:glycosyltransferase [Alteromonas facilis]|uniref:glycosyltransferase n=1 Tax=Alteromonas facilis TaxID=2048004 RepID=UPI000C293AC4|nr:glycosyltransferase [Alteromonas facilis]